VKLEGPKVTVNRFTKIDVPNFVPNEKTSVLRSNVIIYIRGFQTLLAIGATSLVRKLP